jgi:hypothetical protein
MKKARKAKFEKAGWTVGSGADLLGLNEAEAALVEAKLGLGDAVRTVRKACCTSGGASGYSRPDGEAVGDIER